MSGPSTTEAEREALSRRLQVGFVVLVAASGALVAVQAGADPVLIGVGGLAGGIVGAVLAWYLWAIGAGALRGNRRNRR